MELRYNNYHKHDTYGNIRALDSITKPMEYIKRAKELDGDKAIFFSTNHGYQGNIYEYYTLCKENNIKLIGGVEAYYVHDRFEKDKSNYHLVIIAKNKDGFKQINKIMSEANLTGYYYKPRIDDKLLFSLNPNDVVITSACIASRLRDKKGAEEWIIKMKKYFGDSFYLEVQNHNVDIQKEYNKRLLEYANKYKIKIIHANDSHYIYPEDSKYRDLFLKAKGIIYEEENSFILDSAMDKKKLGRFSFISSNPFKVLKYKNTLNNPLDNLQEELKKYKVENKTHLPFIGGAVGYLSYDLGNYIEKLPRTAIDDTNVYDLYFGLYNWVIVVDHLENKTYIATPDLDIEEEK